MRIPKKRELFELQKKYRTDKKIGEVYGVPARLVAYWRTKKKIGAYSFPKHTEEKIVELWERFGDDARAGEELGISKAGFRQWRRKYKITEKPGQLKLEQLELPLPDASRKKLSKQETIIQKVLAKKANLRKVEVGEVINASPELMVSNDNSDEVIYYFNQIGIDRVSDPGNIAIVLNNRFGTKIKGNSSSTHKTVREFARKRKIRHLYDVGQGISHQVILENGLVYPGQLILSTDTHGTAYGCVGAISIGVTTSEMAAAWASGRLWLRVPDTIKLTINGRLARGVFARDVILKLVRDMTHDRISYKAVEFHGSTIASMSISERFTLAALSSGMGIKSAIIPFDDVTARFLRKTAKVRYIPVTSDQDALYSDEFVLDANYLTPQVACPQDNGKVYPIEEVAGKRIEQVVLGSCANGRIDDLEIAARILHGRHVNHDVRMFIIPASRQVYSEALDRGFIRTFIDSGCMVLNAGCGSCIGVHQNTLEPGERALTTADCRCEINGHADYEVFQASPATAAATAIEGAIADPRKYFR